MFSPDSQTPGMLHLFGVTQVQVGGEIFTWGKKGVCEQSNLESLATQGHFDQKFESHQKRKLDLSGNTV